MNVKTYVNPYIDERMYVIIEEKNALIVDPFISEEAEGYLCASKIQSVMVLLTHEHYDHISGVNDLRQKFHTKVISSEKCKENIENPKNNTTSTFPILFLTDKAKYKKVKEELSLPYFCYIDEVFKESHIIKWIDHDIECIAVGGHSPGSSIYIVDKEMAFVGDNILLNGREMKSYKSSLSQYENSFIPAFLGLDKECIIFPGHGECAKTSAFTEYIIRREYKNGN